MHGRAVGGITSWAIAAGCTLGVVDLPPDPSPAEMLVIAQMATDQADASLVHVVVTATLDPGFGSDGTPRRLANNVFGFEDGDHTPAVSGDPPRPTWIATGSYPAPGPTAVSLRFPSFESFGASEGIRMRVRVDVAPEVIPGGAVVLGEGEDLVLSAARPGNPSLLVDWSLQLTSSSLFPATFLRMSGGGEVWPTEFRVPAEDIPAGAFPFQASLRLQWDRDFTLFELTPEERYDLALRSIMLVDWTVQES